MSFAAKFIYFLGIIREMFFTTRPWFSERKIYVRNGGDNNNDGSTALLAVATIDRAIELLDYSDRSGNMRQVVELTSYVGVIPENPGGEGYYHQLPNSSRSAPNNYRPGAFENGKQDFTSYPVEFYADPELVLAVVVTGYTTEPVSGIYTATVSDILVPGAHVGQMLQMGPGEWSVVHSNTTNELVISGSYHTTVGAGGIYTQSCVLSASDLFGFTLTHNSPVAMNGIRFDNTICRSFVNVYSYFQMCRFDNGFYTDGTGGRAICQACYFSGGRVQTEMSSFELFDSVLHGVVVKAHGSGGSGRNAVAYTIFDGCTAYGGGNFESAYDIEVNNTWFMNGVEGAIYKASPYQCVVRNTRIDNCAGDPIKAVCGGGVIHIDAVGGSGSVGHGVVLENGARAQLVGVSTLTASLGDLKIGSAPTLAWADMPANDFFSAQSQGCAVTGGTRTNFDDEFKFGGDGVRVIGTVGPAAVPQDGDIWKDAGGVVYIRSNGSDVAI